MVAQHQVQLLSANETGGFANIAFGASMNFQSSQLSLFAADAVQRQFFINQGTQPVGQSQDAFTGQSTGNKTYDQIAQENAPLYWQNNNRQTLQTMWGGGPIHDPMFVVGDKRNGKPHGTEEVVINWTGAPLDVVSNKEAVKAGLVPAARKRGR